MELWGLPPPRVWLPVLRLGSAEQEACLLRVPLERALEELPPWEEVVPPSFPLLVSGCPQRSLIRIREKKWRKSASSQFFRYLYLVPPSAASFAAKRSFSKRLSGLAGFGLGLATTAGAFGFGLAATGFLGAGGGLSMRSFPP